MIGARVLGTYVGYDVGVGVGLVIVGRGAAVGATALSGVGLAVRSGVGSGVKVADEEEVGYVVESLFGGMVNVVGARVLGTYVEYMVGVCVGSIIVGTRFGAGATVLSGVGLPMESRVGPGVNIEVDEVGGGVGGSV